jgi:hypothetical protein
MHNLTVQRYAAALRETAVIQESRLSVALPYQCVDAVVKIQRAHTLQIHLIDSLEDLIDDTAGNRDALNCFCI